MAQVVKKFALVREVWGSNLEPIKSSTRCQRLATVATLSYGPWRKAAEMGTTHSWHPKRYKASIMKIWSFEDFYLCFAGFIKVGGYYAMKEKYLQAIPTATNTSLPLINPGTG